MAISKWEKVPLKTLCFRIGDGLHGTPVYDEANDAYFINGNNLKNGRIEITSNTNKVAESDYKSGYIELDENSLLLSINGTLGSLAFYEGQKIMLGKSAAYLNFKSPINKFYYYYFQLKDVQQYFYNVATGSTIKNLSLKSIQDFEVPVPEQTEWEAIASVLSSLDTKIELNNRINAELEAMAKTLYDYWFVQFDFPHEFPKAGAPSEVEVKPYKSSGGKMVYNKELKREIPEGWEVKKIKEELDVQYGYPFSTKLFNEEGSGFPIIRIRDILNNSISIYSTEKTDDKYKLEKGDLLIGMDGNFHMNFWDKKDCYLNQRSVRIRKKTTSRASLLQTLFSSKPYIQAREKNVSRTTVGHLSAKDIDSLFVVVPNSNILLKTTKIFDSLLDKLIINRNQNQQLASLRDWLLPMLMNGQVTVKEAEEKLGNLYSSAEQSQSIAAEPEINYKKNE